MKVMIKYKKSSRLPNYLWVEETRVIHDDCYPRVIARISREMRDKGYELIDIRQVINEKKPGGGAA